MNDLILEKNVISIPPPPPLPTPNIPEDEDVNSVIMEQNENVSIAPFTSSVSNQSDHSRFSQNVDAAETMSNSVAQASREAIVDPNSVVDLLDDFGIPNPGEDANGFSIVDLGDIIVVNMHPLPEHFDAEANNGFPNWLLQILGTQVTVEERPSEAGSEPHFYCQGDGLGVHPSILAVEVLDEDEEDDGSTPSTNNTTDFAEVEPGISSQDMSSLPEDSQANTMEIQDPLEEENELHTELFDSLSSSSDTGAGTSKNS